ncbi:MAG: presqualene diphosphate synthase HpnD [Acidobacteria bacterium]|nr:presqualene diphosphate synthase HpnD [Acidobacteriota bacterium]
MKAVSINEIHFTPWHLRDRTRSFRHDLAKTVQSNFFYSFLFLPKAKRDAIIDVYRFCRAVDDIVDDYAETGGTVATAQQALNDWRAEVAALFVGKPTLPLAQRLQTVLQQFPIPQLYFEEMIRGCEMDLQQNRYRTFDELYEYCYRVASITGLMCIEIFTYANPQTKDYAINLGLALQLTNILRDIKEDAGRNRVYLPQEDLQMFGYSERELFAGVMNDNFRALMKFECERARRFYQRATDLLPTEDRSTLIAARTMGKIYFRLIEEIERADYDVFHHQVRLHRPERFLIALNEWAHSTEVSR